MGIRSSLISDNELRHARSRHVSHPYTSMKREQTVSYAPGATATKPMIRIANRFLEEYGFTVGDRVEINYADGLITITHINLYDHDNTMA